MNSDWLKVYIATLFEVVWVTGLKHADHVLEWGATILSIIISFYVFIMAGRKLPMGTVYAVFVGLGTAGTVLSEMILFNEPFDIKKFLLIFLLLIGVVGLKLVTKDKLEERSDS